MLNFHRDRVENDSSCIVAVSDSIKIFSTAIQKFQPLYDMCTCVSVYTFIFMYSFERVFNSDHWIEARSPTVYINTAPYEFPIEKIRAVTRRKIVTSFCLLPIFNHRWRVQVFVEFYFFPFEKCISNRNRDFFRSLPIFHCCWRARIC